MEAKWVDLTPENLASEHLCCIIRTKKPHPGVEAKRQWLAQRLEEGHVLRKLDIKGCVFIEYAPLEKAKNLPCPFNNWAVFYGGKLVTVNQLDPAGIQKLVNKA